jgi:hypothetical protein
VLCVLYISPVDDKLISDTGHWQNLTPPLAPNPEEVKIYEGLCEQGPVVMLGMTKELVHICEYMVDLNPIPQTKPVVKSEWADFNGLAGTIIGDGVLNLAGLSLVDKLMPICDRIVCRVFLKKLEGMKYATHFPTSFPGSSRITHTQPGVAIVVWDN